MKPTTYNTCNHCGATFQPGDQGTLTAMGFNPGEAILLCSDCNARATKGGRLPRAIAEGVIARGGEAVQERDGYWYHYSLGPSYGLTVYRASHSPSFVGCNHYSRTVGTLGLGTGRITAHLPK